MNHWLPSTKFLNVSTDQIRCRRYGMIRVTGDGRASIRFRWWPKRVSIWETQTLGAWFHAGYHRDACRLYYSQPWGSEAYLVLTYVASSRGCSFSEFRRAVAWLDRIAIIKGSDAILCQVTNPRISDRLLRRWGWEPQANSGQANLWIKRFYGDYSAALPISGP